MGKIYRNKNKKDETITFRLPKSEADSLRKKVQKSNLNQSQYIRNSLIQGSDIKKASILPIAAELSTLANKLDNDNLNDVVKKLWDIIK